MWAIGHPGGPEDLAALPEGKREKERADRVRRPLEETVFAEDWGRASAFTES